MTEVVKRYAWEGTLTAVIVGVVVILTLVSHLTARPDSSASDLSAPSHVGAASAPAPSAVAFRRPSMPAKPSNPLVVSLGPGSIGGEFTLLSATRKPATPTSDKLTLRLRVVSHAMGDFVTPFQSVMVEVRPADLEPISPERAFSHPVPAGATREEDIAFIVPSSLILDRSVLRIHFYNEQGEIPLGLLPQGH